MMKNKSLIAMLLTGAMLAGILTGCGASATAQTEEPQATEEATEAVADGITEESESDASSGDITILYTNDVHGYIDNIQKDENGNITGAGLRFSKVAAMKEDLASDDGNVLLVDAGDEVQGSIYGAMDEGFSIIDIMNATGYDLATPGNHDFDYGMFTFMKNVDDAEFTYVSCNFRSLETGATVLDASKIFDIGGKKVAFVGITTPETITSSTPAYFQDENGEFIYTIDGIDDKEKTYASVQKAIDDVSAEADYVIGIGHVGTGDFLVSSSEIIANVSGLDAFIDGHSHTSIEGTTVKDKDGKDVVLTQTGCYLSAIGVMTIGDGGNISTKLVYDYDRVDEKVATLEQDWIQEVETDLGEQIAVLDNTMYIMNPDNENQRLIRAQELNLGDFTADSVYWFFNDRMELPCDVAIQNGGGVRAQIEKGDLTYMSAKQVEPFGNMICLISATGQQIVDCLEMGVTEIGEWDDEWDSPKENGGFIHVAGLTYTIDATIPSSVEVDSNGLFAGVNGEYRVKDVKVYNRESKEYEPIDLEKEYTLGGINYILRNAGNGCSMFDDDELKVDYVGQDYVILAEYIKSFAPDEDGMPKVNTQNSPLSSFEGYLMDYENPYGSGRINIVMN